ncbi:hypothetical protein GCM10028807_19180 [Spirosoma daeguense]
MKPETLQQIYQQMCVRRDAINQHYLADLSLKTNDPTSYEKYRRELRDINKRLRIIRHCIPVNPILLTDQLVFPTVNAQFLRDVTTM